MARDAWIGIFVLGFAALYWHEADKIRISPLDGPVGAPGLPKALAFALGGLAIVLIVRGLYATWARRQRAVAEAPPTEPLREQLQPHLRAIGMLALGIGYLLVVPYLGYALSIMLLMFVVALYIGAPVQLRTAGIAVAGGVVFYLIFVGLLDIPLPPGTLPGLLLPSAG